LPERVGFDQPTGVFVQLVRLRVAGRNTVLLISAGEDKLLRDVAGIVRKLIHGRVLRMGLGRILGASFVYTKAYGLHGLQESRN
jgi:hypothetical protein